MQRTLLGPVLLASAFLIHLSGCGTTQPPPFEPKEIERIQRTQAAQAEPRRMRALPTTLQSPENERNPDPNAPPPGPRNGPAARPYRSEPWTGPTVRMSLQEIIHRAVANNLEVRVAGYDAAIDELRVLEADARFDPSVFSQIQAQKQFPQNNAGTFNRSQLLTQTFQGGLRQNLESGGQIELRAQAQRAEAENAASAFGGGGTQTAYTSELILQLTQPLLKNFGRDVTRARVTIAKNDLRISELDFREKLEKTIQDIEEAYWRLAQARIFLDIQENLVVQTDLTTDILIQRGGHDVNRVQISQAKATSEERALDLINTRTRVLDLSDRLKRLMNDPDMPVSSPVIIVPADEPVGDAVAFSLADQVDTALQYRTELQQQKYRIDSASTIVRAAKNNLLPDLNLQGSVGLQGLGDHLDEAVRNTDLGVWTIALAFEVPIGNRAARAIYQRTLLSRQQTIVGYQDQVQKIEEEVTTAHRAVLRAWDEIGAARQARFAAADALDAIETRERAGEALTPTFVELKLDRQAALARDRQAEAQAMSDYNIAISALERSKGTILRYNNILTKEAAGPELMQFWNKKSWPW